MSMPVGDYGLVASEVCYLEYMGSNKEMQGAHHHVVFQVLRSTAINLLSPFRDFLCLYSVQSFDVAIVLV